VISIERAVVLHLDEEIDPAGGHVRGHAEHVVSGLARRFESLAELLAFLDRVLCAGPHDPEPTA
jgi:hypothetical protein